MPTNFYLAAYDVRLRNIEDREFEDVDSFDGENDLFPVLYKYLDEIRKTTCDDQLDKKILTIKELHRDKDARQITGIIETGYYGLESTLYDVKKKATVHTRTEDEADMLPFFFMFEIPEGTDEAILVTQRTGQYGIRTALLKELAPRFKQAFPSLRLKINPLTTAEQMEELMKVGRVTQIKFVRFGLSSDLADYHEKGHQEIEGRMELIAYARRGQRFDMKKIIEGVLKGKSPKDLISLDTDFDYETVRLRMEGAGTNRQIDLMQLGKIRYYREITDKLTVKKGGQPTFSSIKAVGLEFMSELKSRFYNQ